MLKAEYRLARREPISREVYRKLRLAILRRDVAPGTRIIELEFARALGVSRTPLREALSRLEVDGLVTLLPTGGYVVNDARNELEDIFHLRQAVEGYAARLAARNITDDELARLRKNLEASMQLDLSQTQRRAELNAEFHRTVTDAARSPRLIKAVNDLLDFLFSEETMRWHSEHDMRSALAEHAELVDALAARDEDQAERITRAHLAHALEFLLTKRFPKKSPE